MWLAVVGGLPEWYGCDVWFAANYRAGVKEGRLKIRRKKISKILYLLNLARNKMS